MMIDWLIDDLVAENATFNAPTCSQTHFTHTFIKYVCICSTTIHRVPRERRREICFVEETIEENSTQFTRRGREEIGRGFKQKRLGRYAVNAVVFVFSSLFLYFCTEKCDRRLVLHLFSFAPRRGGCVFFYLNARTFARINHHRLLWGGGHIRNDTMMIIRV